MSPDDALLAASEADAVQQLTDEYSGVKDELLAEVRRRAHSNADAGREPLDYSGVLRGRARLGADEARELALVRLHMDRIRQQARDARAAAQARYWETHEPYDTGNSTAMRRREEPTSSPVLFDALATPSMSQSPGFSRAKNALFGPRAATMSWGDIGDEALRGAKHAVVSDWASAIPAAGAGLADIVGGLPVAALNSIIGDKIPYKFGDAFKLSDEGWRRIMGLPPRVESLGNGAADAARLSAEMLNPALMGVAPRQVVSALQRGKEKAIGGLGQLEAAIDRRAPGLLTPYVATEAATPYVANTRSFNRHPAGNSAKMFLNRVRAEEALDRAIPLRDRVGPPRVGYGGWMGDEGFETNPLFVQRLTPEYSSGMSEEGIAGQVSNHLGKMLDQYGVPAYAVRQPVFGDAGANAYALTGLDRAAKTRLMREFGDNMVVTDNPDIGLIFAPYDGGSMWPVRQAVKGKDPKPLRRTSTYAFSRPPSEHKSKSPSLLDDPREGPTYGDPDTP